MKKLLSTLLVLLPLTLTHAQYDFPVVLNGLSIGLNLEGQQTVYATDFLSLPTIACTEFGQVLINRSTLQFPRGSQPPATASDSLVFDCNDFSTESIELWYQDLHQNWLVADSYVVIFGLQGNCGDCTSSNCQTTAPVLYNGLSVSFDGESSSVNVHARNLVSREINTDEQFSFSAAVEDSVRTFTCADDGLVPVLVYSHRPGFTSQAASTYIALALGSNCGSGDFTGARSMVVQGLSVPNSSAEVVTVPARAFAPKNSPAQQLSFSTDPADTLLTLECDQIGAGGIFINIYNHQTGAPGPPALTYLTGDDTQNHCDDGPENTAANDHIEHALLMDSCRVYHQFTKASNEEIDWDFGTGGNSVWHLFEAVESDFFFNLDIFIDPVDTLQYAIVEYQSETGTAWVYDTGTVTQTDTLLYRNCIISTGRSVSLFYLQISGLREGALTRYYLSAKEIPCPSALNDSKTATLKSYPNPTTGQLTIELPPAMPSRVTLELFDSFGRHLSKQAITNVGTTWMLDLTGQPKGTYFIRLSDEKNAWTSKVVLLR